MKSIYTPNEQGFSVELKGRFGDIEAKILKPQSSKPDEWLIVFGTCTGEALSLAGQTRKRASLRAAQSEIFRLDLILNAPRGEPIRGFRGIPAAPTAMTVI